MLCGSQTIYYHIRKLQQRTVIIGHNTLEILIWGFSNTLGVKGKSSTVESNLSKRMDKQSTTLLIK